MIWGLSTHLILYLPKDTDGLSSNVKNGALNRNGGIMGIS
jgi:hypothetical protein